MCKWGSTNLMMNIPLTKAQWVADLYIVSLHRKFDTFYYTLCRIWWNITLILLRVIFFCGWVSTTVFYISCSTNKLGCSLLANLTVCAHIYSRESLTDHFENIYYKSFASRFCFYKNKKNPSRVWNEITTDLIITWTNGTVSLKSYSVILTSHIRCYWIEDTRNVMRNSRCQYNVFFSLSFPLLSNFSRFYNKNWQKIIAINRWKPNCPLLKSG